MSLYTQTEATRLRMVMLGYQTNPQQLRYLLSQYHGRYTHILVFHPTGWVAKTKRREGLEVTTVELPYSEHSNFPELAEFVRTVRPGSIVPTVYESPQHAGVIVRRLENALRPPPGTLLAYGVRVTPTRGDRPRSSPPPSPPAKRRATIVVDPDVIVID